MAAYSGKRFWKVESMTDPWGSLVADCRSATVKEHASECFGSDFPVAGILFRLVCQVIDFIFGLFGRVGGIFGLNLD